MNCLAFIDELHRPVYIINTADIDGSTLVECLGFDIKYRRLAVGSSATGMLPADQIEEVVVNLLLGALQSPEAIQGVWQQMRRQYPDIDEPTVVLAMRGLGEVWPPSAKSSWTGDRTR